MTEIVCHVGHLIPPQLEKFDGPQQSCGCPSAVLLHASAETVSPDYFLGLQDGACQVNPELEIVLCRDCTGAVRERVPCALPPR